MGPEAPAEVPDALVKRLSQDPLQKAVDPKRLVLSNLNAKGPQATRRRPANADARGLGYLVRSFRLA